MLVPCLPSNMGKFLFLTMAERFAFFFFPLVYKIKFYPYVHKGVAGWVGGWGRLVCVIGVYAIGILVHKVRNGLLVIVNLDFYGCRWYKFSLMI